MKASSDAQTHCDRSCAVLTNLYVYTSPLALATAFRLATNSICYGLCSLRSARASPAYRAHIANRPRKARPLTFIPPLRVAHAEEDPMTPGNWTVVEAGTPGSQCMSVPMFDTFYGVWSRTCFSCFCLGIGYFGIFELGNTFAGQRQSPSSRKRPYPASDTTGTQHRPLVLLILA